MLSFQPNHAGPRPRFVQLARTIILTVARPALTALLLLLSMAALRATTVSIPNASFEAPPVPYLLTPAIPDMDYWEKSPQPSWYYPSNNFDTEWTNLTGTFFNYPFPSSYIDNCDGTQAAFIFAYPEVGILQDYDTVYGTNSTPTHAFDARYYLGSSYDLTVGIIGGVYGTPPLFIGATLELSLYYRDANSNLVTVASTTVTNDTGVFPTNTHFVDFSAHLPAVQATDPWLGKHIGVRIASTVGFDKANGYWDVDNVRLVETAAPLLITPQKTVNGFGFTLRSEPGLRFEILAATNVSLPLSNWFSIGNVTNTSGTTAFLDPAPNPGVRFYRARQLP